MKYCHWGLGHTSSLYYGETDGPVSRDGIIRSVILIFPTYYYVQYYVFETYIREKRIIYGCN